CKLSQMLHHGVGIDLAGRVDFVFELAFALVFILAFAQQAAENVTDRAELILIFHLVFVFQFSLVLQLVFEFRQGFQFIFQLVRHDHSSCEKLSDIEEPSSAGSGKAGSRGARWPPFAGAKSASACGGVGACIAAPLSYCAGWRPNMPLGCRARAGPALP